MPAVALPLLAPVSAQVLLLLDETPEPEDVKAGWLALLVFGLLIAAVVLLMFSFVKRLRNADRAAAEGKFDRSDDQRDPH